MIDRTDPRYIEDERAHSRQYAEYRARFRAVEAAKANGDLLVIEMPPEGVWAVIKDGERWNWSSEDDARGFVEKRSERVRLQQAGQEKDRVIEELRRRIGSLTQQVASLKASGRPKKGRD